MPTQVDIANFSFSSGCNKDLPFVFIRTPSYDKWIYFFAGEFSYISALTNSCLNTISNPMQSLIVNIKEREKKTYDDIGIPSPLQIIGYLDTFTTLK